MEIPPEDPETGVGRLHCHRLTAGHRKGDHHWLRTDLAERREDHPPGVLHDHRTTLAVPLDGKADAPAGW